MADSRRQTRSTRRREQQTDAQFWSNQPDLLMIERGQADAIRLVRSSVNPAPETITEHSQNSRKNVKKHNTASREERRNETVTSAQGEPCQFPEHSRESLDLMGSIHNLHMQQRQNRCNVHEQNEDTPSAHQTP